MGKLLIGSKRQPVNPDILLWEDDFEGGDPTGWDSELWTVAGGNPTPSVSITTTEAGEAYVGAGSSWRQWWAPSTTKPDRLQRNFPSSDFADEGDIWEFEYYMKYDADFVLIDSVKQHIIHNSVGSPEFYIVTWIYGHNPNGQMGVYFQQTTPPGTKYYTNKGGNNYVHPLDGNWYHFRWRIKVATEDLAGPKNGFLHGWIDGVQRWDHNDIYTIFSGTYNGGDFNFDPTTNGDQGNGPDQKRYFDDFKIRKIAS